MAKKKFKLRPEEIRPLLPGCGACIASDLITVEGQRVGFMYRTAPHDQRDSGWTFLTGTEPDEYLQNPDNLAVYELNTIANYDPDMIVLLHHPVGSAFARDSTGIFRLVEQPSTPHTTAKPEHPFVHGVFEFSKSWRMTLPLPFQRRIEAGDLILWRPALTIYVAAYANDGTDLRSTRLEELRADISPDANTLERTERTDSALGTAGYERSAFRGVQRSSAARFVKLQESRAAPNQLRNALRMTSGELARAEKRRLLAFDVAQRKLCQLGENSVALLEHDHEAVDHAQVATLRELPEPAEVERERVRIRSRRRAQDQVDRVRRLDA